jgi:O-antigen ligase
MFNSTALSSSQLLPVSREALYAGCLSLLAATGSIVFMEPAPFDLLAILLLIVLGLSGLAFPRELQLPIILLLVFVLGNVVAATFSEEPWETLRSLAVRIYMPLTWLLLVCLIVVNPGRMLRALWSGYLVAAVIAVFWGAAEYFGFISSGDWAGGLRARGGFKDPNVFGPFLVPASVYALQRLVSGGRWPVLHFGLLALFSFGVLLSFSRGAWINYVVAVGAYALFVWMSEHSTRVRLKWLVSGAIAVFSLLALLSATVSVDIIGDRFAQRAVLTQKYDLQSGGRFDTQARVLQHIGMDPIGVGPGRSDEVFGLEPHNLYLHVFVEAGWLGGLGFFIFIALTLRALIRSCSKQNPLNAQSLLVLACLAGLLLQSFFIDSTHWRHFWLLLAVAWSLIISFQRHLDLCNYHYKTPHSAHQEAHTLSYLAR